MAVPGGAAMSPQTLERQAVGKIFREGFLGPSATDTDFCPVAVPGVSFDETDAASTTPFTPAQVRDEVGFVELTFRQVDSFDSEVTSGVIPNGDFVAGEYTLTRLRFSILVPKAITGVLALVEKYQDHIYTIFRGIRFVLDGPPKVTVRQLSKHAPRLWSDSDEGDWHRRTIDIIIRRHNRRIHAGLVAA